MKNKLFLNSFWLRIIALVTMTIDHIGTFLPFKDFYLLRIVGRIAFPIFLFLCIEGALKTSNKKRYIIRISTMAVIVGIVLSICAFFEGVLQNVAFSSGNIFIDLLLAILIVFSLESPNKKIKPLAILPILYLIYSDIVIKFEGCGCDGLYYWHFPPFRTQYGFTTALLTLGFYYSFKLAPKYATQFGHPESEQFLRNVFSCLVIVISAALYFLRNYLFGIKYEQLLDGVQTYCVLSCLFILFYNGEKGYNSKWFRVAYYLYYPVHIAIIALFFIL